MTFDRRPWTDEEVKLLKAMSMYYPARVVAERLGRGESAVKFKMRSLGIRLLDRGRLPAPKYTDWTDAELKILKKYAGHKTSIELAELLPNRSSKAIRLKAAQLGLTLFKKPWTEEDLTNLLRLREQGHTFKEIATVFDRTPEACRAKYNYLTKP